VSPSRRLAAIAGAAVLGWLAAIAGAHARVSLDDDTPSRSIGTSAEGRLEHGHPMPPRGFGFVTYSHLGAALGRQYVHDSVRDLFVDAFGACARARPDRRFVVGETGWPHGGGFWPHRSHENGMSVDVFMPLRDAAGAPASVPTWPWNRFGYGVDFDDKGKLGDLRIDFDELAALLVEVGARAPSFGLRVSRFIVAPEYVPLILATPTGKTMGRLGALLSRHAAWWRHDEHVHVELAQTAAGAASPEPSSVPSAAPSGSP
jgi:penicillin-insensitive murein endopeptidase